MTCAFWYIKRIPNASSLLNAIKLSSFRPDLLRSFLSFGGVTIFTGFVVTATWLLARREVLHSLGPDALGFFSATITLSGLGLSLLSTALSSFYLPRFAAAEKPEKPRILKSVLLMVLPFVACVFIALQTAPHILVELLFSKKFLPMIPLLRWWVAGDAIRAISSVFAIPIFAAAHLRFLFFSEVFFSMVLIFGIHLALQNIGSLAYVGQVYLATYLLYLFTVFIFAKSRGYVF
jgi:PST family polysaccharide transporter